MVGQYIYRLGLDWSGRFERRRAPRVDLEEPGDRPGRRLGSIRISAESICGLLYGSAILAHPRYRQSRLYVCPRFDLAECTDRAGRILENEYQRTADGHWTPCRRSSVADCRSSLF